MMSQDVRLQDTIRTLFKLSHMGLQCVTPPIIIKVNQPPNIMRKIEEQMNNAIRHRKNWSGSNTTVTCYKKDGITTEVNVMLHGNCIAWFDTASNDFNISSAGWETVTTKSRLNAILEEFASGSRVIQKNFEWFLSDFGTLKPFVDGMKI